MKTFTGVKIKKLVYGGYGLGWSGGQTLFVKNVLPDEVVNIQQTGKLKGSLIAQVVDIIEPSTNRRKAPCPYFQVCGGCDWLHISYPAQVTEKKNILIECFKRIGKIHHMPSIEIFTSHEWEYRIRVQFNIDSKNKKIGFFKHNSHTIVDITHCPLIDPSLNSLLKEKNTILPLISESIKQFRALAGRDGDIASFPVLKNRTGFYTDIRVGSRIFKVSGKSFFQANKYLHHNLGTWAGPRITKKYCIDMYGGTGFFSCLLGDIFEQGILIEMDKNQVLHARENMKRNNIHHFKAIQTQASLVVPSSIPFPSKEICIILDPPRVGISKKVLQNILHLMPGQIIYISCNPSTQARDIGRLLTDGNYTLSHIAFFDLYPNTHHIESAVILER